MGIVFSIFISHLIFDDSFVQLILSRIIDISSDKSGGRFGIWIANINMFIDNPFLGVGPDSSFLRDEYFEIDTPVLQTHNLYLQLLSEFGLVGFIIFILFIKKIIQLSLFSNKFSLHEYDGMLALGLVFSLITIILNANFIPALIDPLMWGIFGIISGLAVKLIKTSKLQILT